MNIAIFTDTFVPQINGVSEVIKNLKKGLELHGHKVWVIAPHLKGYYDSDPHIIRLPAIVFPGVSEHRISLPVFSKINSRFIKKEKIDIIHSQTIGPVGLMAMLLALKMKLPHIHHYQTFFEDYVHYVKLPKAFSKYSVRKISCWFCNRTDLVTVPTYPFKTLLESYGVTQKIKLWQSGIDINRFKKGNSIRSELKIPSDAFVLVFVGRVAKEKNISFLIEIMPSLSHLKRDIRLLIVGDGPVRKELEDYAKILKVRDKIIFTGYIPPERIPDVYHSSDVFVFSSLTETQGLVTFEAMAAGLPVVAVSAYGIKYTLQNCKGALLVNLNHRDFISQIEKLMDKNFYKKMSKNSLSFVKNYDYLCSTKEIEKIYKSLL